MQAFRLLGSAMATMNRDGAAGKGGNSRGLVLGLLLGVLLGGLLLAPKARAPVVAQLKKTEMALKELQASYDKIKADSDAAGTQLKAEMDVLKADAKKAADQLKECQDKNGGSVMKQKLADARAKLDEASKHLSEMGAR